MVAPPKHKLPAKVRWFIHLLAATLVAVLLGKVVELVLSKDALSSLLRVQDEAIHGVENFDPLDIAMLYGCSFLPDDVRDCYPAFDPVVRDRKLDIGLGHWAYANKDNFFIVFLAAAADVVWHLIFNTSVVASLFALIQFLFGFAAWIALDNHWAEDKDYRSIHRSPLFFILLPPLATILFGCLFGWATKYVMLAGLYAFRWATSLAALCCGSAYLAYLGYSFGVRLVEGTLHEAIKRVIRRI